jgi:hypothetical protein
MVPETLVQATLRVVAPGVRKTPGALKQPSEGRQYIRQSRISVRLFLLLGANFLSQIGRLEVHINRIGN